MNEGIWLEIGCLWSDAFLLHFLDTVKTRKVKKSLVTRHFSFLVHDASSVSYRPYY